MHIVSFRIKYCCDSGAVSETIGLLRKASRARCTFLLNNRYGRKMQNYRLFLGSKTRICPVDNRDSLGEQAGARGQADGERCRKGWGALPYMSARMMPFHTMLCAGNSDILLGWLAGFACTSCAPAPVQHSFPWSTVALRLVRVDVFGPAIHLLHHTSQKLHVLTYLYTFPIDPNLQTVNCTLRTTNTCLFLWVSHDALVSHAFPRLSTPFPKSSVPTLL